MASRHTALAHWPDNSKLLAWHSRWWRLWWALRIMTDARHHIGTLPILLALATDLVAAHRRPYGDIPIASRFRWHTCNTTSAMWDTAWEVQTIVCSSYRYKR